MKTCSTGKRVYNSRELAEDALIEAWSHNDYRSGSGPTTIYQCDDCGLFHFTSKGKMNERLEREIASGKIKLNREAGRWLDKFKNF